MGCESIAHEAEGVCYFSILKITAATTRCKGQPLICSLSLMYFSNGNIWWINYFKSVVQFHVSDDVITLDVTWEDILWQCYLVVVGQSSTCKLVKVIKLFKKIASKDSGRFFSIIIIYFYNYYYYILPKSGECKALCLLPFQAPWFCQHNTQSINQNLYRTHNRSEQLLY